jgi:hypothetical protein
MAPSRSKRTMITRASWAKPLAKKAFSEKAKSPRHKQKRSNAAPFLIRQLEPLPEQLSISYN